MPRYVAFLRAINVGGHTVSMDRLRTLFTALKFTNVETFIASGNVIFDARAVADRKLEQRIEKHLAAALGYEVATFVRTPGEVEAIAAHQPFAPELQAEAATYNVGFLHETPSVAATGALLALQNPDDFLHINGRELYWLGKKKQSEAVVSNRLFEKALGTPATLRGHATLIKLLKKYPPK